MSKKVWQRIGVLGFVACVIPGVFACTCDPEDTQPPASTCAASVDGTEARAVQVIDGVLVNRDVFLLTPLSSGDEIARVAGFQGSDMVTSIVRVDAAMDDGEEGSERCMRVSYAGVSMNFERDLTFEREGRYWVLSRQIFDPIEGGGTFTQTITVQDSLITGTSTLSLTVR